MRENVSSRSGAVRYTLMPSEAPPALAGGFHYVTRLTPIYLLDSSISRISHLARATRISSMY